MPENPVAVVLVAGDEERDRPTLDGLARAGLQVLRVEDPAELFSAIREAEAAVAVLDAENEKRIPDPGTAGFRTADGRAVPSLWLLPEGGPPAHLADAGSLEHYLTRPFSPATLAALCRALAGEAAPGPPAAARPAEAPSPTLRLRRPARYSARPLYGEAVSSVRTALETARRGDPPDPVPLGLLAERIHTSLLQSNLLLLRALEPYARFELSPHCVNVGVIAGKVAIGLELPLVETHRVIQAGLLHDVGMTRLPEGILLKEGAFSDSERLEMQRHPLYGEEMLGKLGAEWEWLRRAVRQEHERLRGQGYPEGRRGGEIDRTAQIIGVADVFEALSQVRSYRSPFTLYEALEKVTAMREEYFPAAVVDALVSEIAVFPVDSYVQLSTGEIGRVVGVHATNLMRPTVELLWDAGWRPLSAPRTVDLVEQPDLSIARPLHEAEVPIT